MNNSEHSSIKVFGIYRTGDGRRKIVGEFDNERNAHDAAEKAPRVCPGWVAGNRFSEGFSPYYYEVVPVWRSAKFGPATNKISL